MVLRRMTGVFEPDDKAAPVKRPAKLPQVAILVPVYNEAENVKPMVREVAAAFADGRIPYELVFVDDGSRDQTWEEIQAAVRAHPEVRGLRHCQNRGQSAAVWTGILRTTTPLIATLDGDLQNNPADIPSFFRYLEEADLICGVRQKRQDTWVRRCSSKIARWTRKTFLGVDFQDTGCALRLFKRELVGHLFPFNGMHRFLPLLAYWGGAVVKEVPVLHRSRQFGLSKYGIWNRLGRGIADVMALRWYRRRCFFRVAQPGADGKPTLLPTWQREAILEAKPE
jgi:dolichol-phosphate mannosyltransferase